MSEPTEPSPPPSPPQMSIGMFSRASLLSVKALRNYHESGLLIPSTIDPDTGYRVYDPGQLADAAIIYELRSLDLPLKDIGEIVSARDPDVTAAVLTRHATEMELRLRSTKRIVDTLTASLDTPSALTPPHVRTVEHQHVLAFEGVVDRSDYATFLDRAYGALYAELALAGTAPASPAGALYPARVDEQEDVVAFVPIAEPIPLHSASSLHVRELPAARVAVFTHHGSYETVGDAYRHLGHWVAMHERPLDAPVREHYLVSVNDDVDPESYITEIQWELQP